MKLGLSPATGSGVMSKGQSDEDSPPQRHPTLKQENKQSSLAAASESYPGRVPDPPYTSGYRWKQSPLSSVMDIPHHQSGSHDSAVSSSYTLPPIRTLSTHARLDTTASINPPYYPQQSLNSSTSSFNVGFSQPSQYVTQPGPTSGTS